MVLTSKSGGREGSANSKYIETYPSPSFSSSPFRYIFGGTYIYYTANNNDY